MPAVGVLVNAAEVETFAVADPDSSALFHRISSAWDGAGLD